MLALFFLALGDNFLKTFVFIDVTSNVYSWLPSHMPFISHPPFRPTCSLPPPFSRVSLISCVPLPYIFCAVACLSPLASRRYELVVFFLRALIMGH